MSRSGYHDDIDDWLQYGGWRGAVTSAMRGRRGQAFLKEMLAALDALPEKRLIAGELAASGEVCAIGAVGRARGTEMTDINPEDNYKIAAVFGIAHAMACEIMFWNDEATTYKETPEARFSRMRRWVEQMIRQDEQARGT